MEKNINKNIFDSGYFYWFIRVIAFCIDYIIIVLISVPIDRFVTNESMSMSMVVILFILYFTFVPHYLGRTIGQFIFGGRMINTSTQQAQEIPKLFFRVLLSLLIFIPIIAIILMLVKGSAIYWDRFTKTWVEFDKRDFIWNKIYNHIHEYKDGNSQPNIKNHATYCTKCGSRVNKSNKFCAKCGKKIEK